MKWHDFETEFPEKESILLIIIGNSICFGHSGILPMTNVQIEYALSSTVIDYSKRPMACWKIITNSHENWKYPAHFMKPSKWTYVEVGEELFRII